MRLATVPWLVARRRKERLHCGGQFSTANVAHGSISRIRRFDSNDRDLSAAKIRSLAFNDPFYEDWFVKHCVALVAAVGDTACASIVIRGRALSEVRADARTTFYPCRTLASGTPCCMRTKRALAMPTC